MPRDASTPVPSEPPLLDRRARRSRAALIDAATTLVVERQTSDLSVTELAEAADVGRGVLYQQFGDRDSLLVAAALSHLEQFLDRASLGDLGAFEPLVPLAEILDEHRAFYRPLLTGTCAHRLMAAVADLVRPWSEAAALRTFEGVSPTEAAEIADYFTGGTVMAVCRWLTDPEPTTPSQFVDQLARLSQIVGAGERRPGR